MSVNSIATYSFFRLCGGFYYSGHWPFIGQNYFDSVFSCYTKGKFSTSNPQVSEQIHWDVHSHLSCCVSSSSSLPTSSVAKKSFLQNSSGLNWVYNKKVSLSQGAKEDVVWWINHLSQNSSQTIILPSPNKIITTDSSDFGWGI